MVIERHFHTLVKQRRKDDFASCVIMERLFGPDRAVLRSHARPNPAPSRVNPVTSPVQLYSIADVQSMYGVSRGWVLLRIKDGSLTPLRLGRFIKFTADEVYGLVKGPDGKGAFQ